MTETLTLERVPDVPKMGDTLSLPAPELPSPATRGGARLAIEEIMRTDPDAAFDWPASVVPTRGVTYTPPTGDA